MRIGSHLHGAKAPSQKAAAEGGGKIKGRNIGRMLVC